MAKGSAATDASNAPSPRILLPDEAAYLNKLLDQISDAADSQPHMPAPRLVRRDVASEPGKPRGSSSKA